MRTAPFVAVIGGLMATFLSVLLLSDRLASRDRALADERGRRDFLERDLRNARTAEALAGVRLEEMHRAFERARGEVAAATKAAKDAGLARDTVQAELHAAQDRLEKAYKDIAEMERQIVEVSKAKNEVERKLRYLEDPHHGVPPHWSPREPKIEGVVLGVSDKVNLVLISVGKKDEVQVGHKFTVYRNGVYVSKLVVDRVDDTWAACRELEEFRKDKIQQGDTVSTEVK